MTHQKKASFQQAQLQQLHNQAKVSSPNNKFNGYKSAMVDKGIRFQLTKDHSLHPQIKHINGITNIMASYQ